jgi:hypothetical protein
MQILVNAAFNFERFSAIKNAELTTQQKSPPQKAKGRQQSEMA